MPFVITSKGDYRKLTKYLNTKHDSRIESIMRKYGEKGVSALSRATPVRTGLTARSWHYKIERRNNGYSLSWYNSNVIGTTPVVILIQYGHGTGTGGYVRGIDFINPALKPIFESIGDELWKEVNK